MTRGTPAVPGLAISGGSRHREAGPGEDALLGPFIGGRSREAMPSQDETAGSPQSPVLPALSESIGEVADRLERIAGSLRNTAPGGILARGAGGKDALELLITAFALGYHEGRTRAPTVDPPGGSS